MGATVTQMPIKPPEQPAAKVLTLETFAAFCTKLKGAVAGVCRFTLSDDDLATLNAAKALKVTADSDSIADAGAKLVVVKRIRRAGEAHYASWKAPINAVRAIILNGETADVGGLEGLEKRLDREIVSCRRELLRRDQERQAQLQAEADERAQQQHNAQVAALNRVAETEADPSVRAALEAEAEALAEAPVVAETVEIESEAPHVPGLSFTKRYKVEIRGDGELRKLAKAIGNKKSGVPVQAMIGLCPAKDWLGKPREGVYTSTYLNDQARAHEGALGWPGVSIVLDEGTTGR